MACTLPQLQEALVQVTGRFGQETWYNDLVSNNLIQKFKKATVNWQFGQGFTLTYRQIEQVKLLGDVNTAPIDGTQCTSDRTTQRLGGTTFRNVTLQQQEFNTEATCLTNLTASYEYEQQFENWVRNLKSLSDQWWTRFGIKNFRDNAGHKVVADSNVSYQAMSQSSIAFPAVAPVTAWTAGLASQIHAELMDTYGDNYAVGYDNGGLPIYEAWIGRDSLVNMIRNDPSVRQDRRDAMTGLGANSGLEGIIPLSPAAGYTYTYQGFRYHVLPQPPRYDLVLGAWVERFPYATVNAVSVGVASNVVDPLWKNASTEDVIIYNPEAGKLIIPSLPSRFPGADFGPKPTTGTYTWLNGEWLDIPVYDNDGVPIPGQTCKNINRDWGFWHYRYVAGWLPANTALAYVVRVLRCSVPLSAKACLTSI